jgi:ribonuclease HI
VKAKTLIARSGHSTTHIVHIEGAGMRPDGSGSGYGWINVTTGRRGVKWSDGLTNNEAEYRGLIYALLNLRVDSVLIHSDSQLLVSQFNGELAVREPRLRVMLRRVHLIIRERHLKVIMQWLPRNQNLAGRLL